MSLLQLLRERGGVAGSSLPARPEGPVTAEAAHPDCPAPEHLAPVNAWPSNLRDLWEERAAILEYDWDMSRDEAEREAFNRITAGSSSEPAPAPASASAHAPACGHTDTVTVIHVDGYGSLCGACWTRWVAGGMDWPEQHGDQS